MNIIKDTTNFYNEYFIPDNVHYNVTDKPILSGYNITVSGRSGGKTTSILSWAFAMWVKHGKRAMIVRSYKTETVESNIMTMCDGLNQIVDDGGKNIIQRMTHDKYNHIYYISRRKIFVVAKVDSTDTEIKNAPVFCYIRSLDQSSDMASGFADNECNIIFFDECVDDRITPRSFLQLQHIISTVFRHRYNECVVFMAGNVSRGNPQILIDLEVYKNIQTTQTEYFVKETSLGTKIGVTLYNQKSEYNESQIEMNKRFFGFKKDGMEVIRGVAVPQQLIRQLPTNSTLSHTKFGFKALNEIFDLYYSQSDNYQSMYYVKHSNDISTQADIFLTDDEYIAYTEPYTYFNAGKEFPVMIDFIKHYRRNDVAFSDYICKVAIDSLLDLHHVPTVI